MNHFFCWCRSSLMRGMYSLFLYGRNSELGAFCISFAIISKTRIRQGRCRFSSLFVVTSNTPSISLLLQLSQINTEAFWSQSGQSSKTHISSQVSDIVVEIQFFSLSLVRIILKFPHITSTNPTKWTKNKLRACPTTLETTLTTCISSYNIRLWEFS